jgi:hypothetical protein
MKLSGEQGSGSPKYESGILSFLYFQIIMQEYFISPVKTFIGTNLSFSDMLIFSLILLPVEFTFFCIAQLEFNNV